MQLLRSKEWWADRIKSEHDVPIGAGGAFCARPTIRQRIWWALGYHHTPDSEALFDWRNEEPKPGDWWKVGALSTHVTVYFGWADRLRLLLTGTCEVTSYTRTNVPVDRAETRSQIAVLSPQRLTRRDFKRP